SDDEVAARNSAASRLPTAARDPRRPSVRQPDGGELLARLSREPAAVPLLRRFDLRLDHRVRRGGVHRPRTRARTPDSRHDRHVDGPGDHGPRTHFVRGPSRPPGDGIRRLVLRDLHTPLLAPAQLADRARDPFGEPRGTPRGDHRRLRDHGSPRADPRRVLGGPGELPGRLRPRRGHRRRELPSFAFAVGWFSMTSAVAPSFIYTSLVDRAEQHVPSLTATRELVLNTSRTVALLGGLGVLSLRGDVYTLYLLVGGVILLEALAK